MTVFTFTPSYSLSQQSEPQVRKVQFQEAGFEHRLRFGLQTDLKKYQLVFSNRTDAERDSITDFFELYGGADAFDWTSPTTGTSSKYVCEQWQVEMISFNNNTISAMFREVRG